MYSFGIILRGKYYNVSKKQSTEKDLPVIYQALASKDGEVVRHAAHIM